jgi:PAS domain S-box-containing protein
MIIVAILARQLPDFPFTSLIPTYVGFAFVSLLAWLTARGVETTLRDLRKLNLELDQRVVARTRELAESLARERIEAGRSIAILESITDGVIVFDIGGKAIVANPATIQLLNIPHDQVVNASIHDLTRANALDANNRRILSELLSNPSQQPAAYRVHWGRKTFSVSSAQVFDTEETRIGTVAVFRDFTHEAEIEKMKDTILATVSHELRTPLNAILGHVEMLKEAVYGPINEKQARAAERVISNTRRLLDIVSDLLDQAQIEAGKMSLKIEPFKPRELLDNVRGLMSKMAADKRLALTGELEPELPEILVGDPARLQQILVNLVNNALKFTEKGSVDIRLFRPDSQRWAMEVRDTGKGIPEDEQEHIFEPFHQVDNTITRKHAGFGLGLSIVNQLAALMGGSVVVKSAVGAGSVFTVTLPIVQTGGVQNG